MYSMVTIVNKTLLYILKLLREEILKVLMTIKNVAIMYAVMDIK